MVLRPSIVWLLDRMLNDQTWNNIVPFHLNCFRAVNSEGAGESNPIPLKIMCKFLKNQVFIFLIMLNQGHLLPFWWPYSEKYFANIELQKIRRWIISTGLKIYQMSLSNHGAKWTMRNKMLCDNNQNCQLCSQIITCSDVGGDFCWSSLYNYKIM